MNFNQSINKSKSKEQKEEYSKANVFEEEIMDDDSFNFDDDGWGDDGLDDLEEDDIISHDNNNDIHDKTKINVTTDTGASIELSNVNPTTTNYPPVSQKQQVYVPPPPPTPPPKHAQKVAQKLSSDISSFGDNDDMEDENWDWNEDDDDIGLSDGLSQDMGQPPPPSSPPSQQQHQYQSPNRRPPPPPPQVPPPPLPHPPQVTVMTTTNLPPTNNQTPAQTKLEKKLLRYISRLTKPNNSTPYHKHQTSRTKSKSSSFSLLQSINQKFQTIKNNHNPETALQLCRYYHQRPHLTAYTIDTEVPRMEYQIMVSDEMVLLDANEIQAYFQCNPIDNLVDDMLLRASNQSLLADLFPIITTSDEKDDYDDDDGDGNGNDDDEDEDGLSHASDLSSNLSFGSSTSSLSSNLSFDGGAAATAADTEAMTETTNAKTDEVDAMTGGGKEREEYFGIVQSQFFATAVATKCKFVLDMREDHDRTTQVECVLTISIPCQPPQQQQPNNNGNNNNNKLNIATARFMVHFSPEPNAPFVKYHLISIQPLVSLDNPTDLQNIRIAARTIDEMTSMMQPDDDDDHDCHGNGDNGNNIAHDANYQDYERDHFLQSIISTQTTLGFKSALQEIDSVVNVKSKFNFIKDALPVLPSADDIMMASDAAALDEIEDPRRQQQQRSFPPPPRPSHQHQHQQQQQQQQNPKAGRPIIGGLLLSGISHLAEAVTAPDTHTTTPPKNNNSIPKLYRKDDEVENDNNNNDDNSNTQNGIPKLYRKDDKFGNDVHKPSKIPKLYRKDNEVDDDVQKTSVQQQQINIINNNTASDDIVINDNGSDIDEDGWSDDIIDNLDDLDDDGDNDSKAAVRPPPPPPKTEKQTVLLDVKNSVTQVKQSTIDNLDIKPAPNKVTQKQQQQEERKQQNVISRMIDDDLAIKMKELMKLRLETNTYVPEDFVYDAKTGIIPTRSRFVPHSDLLSSL